jgi:hypothetical protein
MGASMKSFLLSAFMLLTGTFAHAQCTDFSGRYFSAWGDLKVIITQDDCKSMTWAWTTNGPVSVDFAAADRKPPYVYKIEMDGKFHSQGKEYGSDYYLMGYFADSYYRESCAWSKYPLSCQGPSEVIKNHFSIEKVLINDKDAWNYGAGNCELIHYTSTEGPRNRIECRWNGTTADWTTLVGEVLPE